jgi:2-O-methyltransferase
MLKTVTRQFLSRLRSEWNFAKKRIDQSIIANEKINKNYIRDHLPSKPVIIDAGAHDGSDSIEMCRLFRGAIVHAFEPVPEIFERLKQHTQKFDRIKCYNLALGNRNGVQTMHISSGASDGSSSLLQPKQHLADHPDVFFNKDLLVQTVLLDDWAVQHKIDRVDFLWLDMQGYELEVLRSSRVVLSKVRAIHMEVSTRITYEGVPLYDEVRDWMGGQGFRVQVEAIPKGWDMGNVLFVRNK